MTPMSRPRNSLKSISDLVIHLLEVEDGSLVFATQLLLKHGALNKKSVENYLGDLDKLSENQKPLGLIHPIENNY